MHELPARAAWRHLHGREGFEVLFPRTDPHGYVLEGHTTAVEDGEAWSVRYALTLDGGWLTRSAQVWSRSAATVHELRLEGDGQGGWEVDGVPAPELAGCLDVDLEASVCTNAIPVRRLALDLRERAEAPAVYVRAPSLGVQRLDQSYRRLPGDGPRQRYEYAAPVLDFRAALTYDEDGLVLDYPGLAQRVA